VVGHQDKDQAAGLEMAELFILCSHQAFKTHIKSIAIFIHEDDRVEVVQDRLANKEGDVDLTKLESEMSFLQVKASMSMKEKLRQVRSPICMNWREIAHTRLDAIAGANNPFSLITIFGMVHLAINQEEPCLSRDVHQSKWSGVKTSFNNVFLPCIYGKHNREKYNKKLS
jgi:hypothetical protein